MSVAPELSPLEALVSDRRLAHQTFFDHRHHDETPAFHYDIIDFLHARHRLGVILAFRGAAKSTIAEEDITLDACLGLFHNCVIVGSSETRAVERLLSVTHELETNELLIAAFGRQRTPKQWTQTKIVLKNGVVVQAIGRDQAVRGLKHLDWRPDYILLDDIEDRENVQTALGREKTIRWYTAELEPITDPRARIRVLATPMDADSVPVRFIRDDHWPHLVVPIKRRNESGEWEATWPQRYPLPEVDEIERRYSRLGALHTFNQEFMCDTSPGESGTVFPRLPAEHRIRTYEPVYCMVDPAKSTGSRAATTGLVAFSFLAASRIHIWHAEAGIWLPDEIIDKILWLDETFSPVKIGVEETSLEEFIRQPLRAAALRHNRLLPIFHYRAPQGKIDFIRGLQPFAKGGEITVNERFEDLDEQLANFPSGRIDLPNALAYAQWMKPGIPVYEGFNIEHVAESLYIDRQKPLWLALNATKTMTTGVLLQYAYGKTQIFADYVMEEEPGVALARLVREAGMVSRHDDLRCCCGPQHWDRYMNVGLVQALQKIPLEVERGTPPDKGRETLRDEFGRLVRGEPAVRVARGARYTIGGFAGGYARPLDRRYNPAAEPEAGLYRTLLEGLESCLGSMAVEQDVHKDGNWATTDDGRRYLRYGTPEARR